MNTFRVIEKCTIILLSAVFVSLASFAQITVLEGNSEKPIDEVAVWSAEGVLLCRTDSKGKVPCSINTFPVFFQKEGYATQGLYGLQDGKAVVRLFRMGGTLQTVEIKGELNVKDHLLHLVKEVNKPDFFHGDSVIYYKFSYRLSFPNDKWQESAQGYIRVHRMPYLATTKDDGMPDKENIKKIVTNYRCFVQFHYQNTGTQFVRQKPFKEARPMPPDFLFSTDFMEPQVIGSIWDNITHDYTFVEKMKPFSGAKVYGNRVWKFVTSPDSNKIFYAANKKSTGQLMEKVVFDKTDKLQSITLYTPNILSTVGGIKLVNDFSAGNNEINTFRTKYTYSKDRKKNRLLSSMQHTSTYFERNVTYYKLEFSIDLADSVPQEQCNIPIENMSATEYSINRHGYGVWELLKKKGLSK